MMMKQLEQVAWDNIDFRFSWMAMIQMDDQLVDDVVVLLGLLL